MLVDTFTVDSPDVVYSDTHITTSYEYKTNDLERGPDGSFTVRPVSHKYQFSVERTLPKVGCVAIRPCLLYLHSCISCYIFAYFDRVESVVCLLFSQDCMLHAPFISTSDVA